MTDITARLKSWMEKKATEEEKIFHFVSEFGPLEITQGYGREIESYRYQQQKLLKAWEAGYESNAEPRRNRALCECLLLAIEATERLRELSWIHCIGESAVKIENLPNLLQAASDDARDKITAKLREVEE